MKFDWSLRCNECGLYTTGHGAMPVHGEYWICGTCRQQRTDFDLDVRSRVFDLDVPKGI